MRMAANSPDTFPLVGRLGLQLFVGVRDLDVAELRDHIAAYRKGWRDGGHAGDGDVYLRIPMYAAPSDQAAREEPYENTMFFFRRQAEMARGGVVAGRSSAGSRASTSSPAFRTTRSSPSAWRLAPPRDSSSVSVGCATTSA